MSDYTGLLLIVIVPMIISVVLYFVSRTIFRIFMFITTVMFIISLIVGGFLLNDAYKLNNELQYEENGYVLIYKNETIAGFSALLENQSITFYTNETLDDLAGQKISNVKNVFLMSNELLEKYNYTEEEISPGVSISKENILEILYSENAFDAYAAMVTESNLNKTLDDEQYFSVVRQDIESRYSDHTQFKSELFFYLFSNVLQTEGPHIIFVESKNGSLKVVPQRMTFLFINLMPESIIRQSVSIKAMQQ